MTRKSRSEIPKELAARILFQADRTCCVCRIRGKPVQLHHIDEDPANHAPLNLAVLCFDCHRETQLRGGFDRKLDADQVILYRDDWVRLVAQQRAAPGSPQDSMLHGKHDIVLETSIAEIYRERGQYQLLAMHYNRIGNKELRDKYIDLILSNNPEDED